MFCNRKRMYAYMAKPMMYTCTHTHPTICGITVRSMCEPLSSCSMDFARQALTGPGSNPRSGGSPSSKLTWFAECLGTLLPSTPCPTPPRSQPHHRQSQSTSTTTIDETSKSVADTRLPHLVSCHSTPSQWPRRRSVSLPGRDKLDQITD